MSDIAILSVYGTQDTLPFTTEGDALLLNRDIQDNFFAGCVLRRDDSSAWFTCSHNSTTDSCNRW
jgi:hypothetical protein